MEFATKAKITWCPGCPNAAILVAFRQAVTELVNDGKLKPENLVAASGIGCHGKITDYLNTNTFTSLHGRVIASMEGIKVANPALTIVGFSGDGDSYSEGVEHLVHAARRNSDINLFIHDNQVFALTTGQATPTSPKGFKGRSTPSGTIEEPFNPLLLMLTYFFVFGVVIRDPALSRSEFALYFLAGMLPWLPFSEAAGRAPNVILEHRNFVKKLVFAVETLPVNLVVSGLVTELFAVLLYCGFLLAIRHTIPLTALWLPALLIPQVLFTAGISWFLAGLGAFVRDLGQIIGFLLTVWFFMTPICYPERQLTARFPFMTRNPMFVLVHSYRDIFLANHAPALGTLWKLSVLAILVFVLGHAWFYKLRKSFADMI